MHCSSGYSILWRCLLKEQVNVADKEKKRKIMQCFLTNAVIHFQSMSRDSMNVF